MSEIHKPQKSLEKSVLEAQYKGFTLTVNAFAEHAAGVSMESGENPETGERFTDFLFVFEEGSYSPKGLNEMKIQLGLDSEIVAIVTSDGGGLAVSTPLSLGKMREVFEVAGEVDHKIAMEVSRLSESEEIRSRSILSQGILDMVGGIRAQLDDNRRI